MIIIMIIIIIIIIIIIDMLDLCTNYTLTSQGYYGEIYVDFSAHADIH